ncbi:MAG: ABC transporter permease [Thermoprotei archaeon]|nr:MAG: ABC transporter permease [Thermoprotei archaeon]
MINFSYIWNRYKIQFAIFFIFISFWLVFLILNPSAFLNLNTYTAIASYLPFSVIPALSLTYIMICGEIDLSFPSVMALASFVLAVTWKSMGGAHIIGVILALLAGLIAGLLNGVLVTKAKIPSMIATLATMFFWRGVVLVSSQGFGIPLGEFKGTVTYDFFVGRVFSFIPAQAIWMLIFTTLLWLILNRHIFGAHVYFTGDNRIAAEYMGINTRKILITVFALHGVISAFAGMLATLEMATFWPALGEAYLMKSIAIVVIGGTSIFGGSGTIIGALIGGLTLGLIEMGLLAVGVAGFWINLVYGTIIIIALILQTVIRETEMKKALKEKIG